jgi:glycosyltransferase involved in cell wall biosynthesis
MRILVVSTLPPRPCGIGTYAAAQVAALREEGHDVTVISPPDGRGDLQVPFEEGRPFREAERRGADADRIIVHFQPGLYYRPGAAAAVSKIRASYGLFHLVRRRPQVEILVHEVHRPTRWRPDHVILRRAFARASLLFHTDAERRAFAREYRLEPRGRLVEHAEAVSSVVATLGRTEARRRLGLDPAEPLLLCAGFIHPWKGFDRAIRAFAASGLRGRLAIVGSVREHAAAIDTYAAELRALAAATDGAQLVETFQTDEGFDTWISAADRIVLPYTRAWSSGVLARARVIGTPAILTPVGGLAEQAGPDDEIVSSDEELTRAFARLGDAPSPDRAVDEADASSRRPGP